MEETSITNLEIVLLCTNLVLAGIAVLAEMRHRRSIPKLKLSLDSERGAVNVTRGGIQGRYFILTVSNKNTHVAAANVRVQILEMARSRNGFSWQNLPVNGPVQVSWRRPQEMPQAVNVGADVQCTFLALLQGAGQIRIQVVGAIPNNFTSVIAPDELIRMKFKAISDNAFSKHLTVTVHWDGEWPNEDDVPRHVKVAVAQHLWRKS